LIERTHDANAASIRGPNGKADAADAIDRCEMGPKFLVCVPMCPFGQQMDVDLAEQRRKAIWIFDFVIVSADREAQPIGKRAFGVQAAREKPPEWTRSSSSRVSPVRASTIAAASASG